MPEPISRDPAGHVIGRVLILDGHGIATLYGKDRWHVVIDGKHDPEWDRELADQYRGTYQGPQDGTYGVAILNDLARIHDSYADILVSTVGDPTTIY